MRDIIAAGLADLGLLDRVPEQAPSQLAEYGHLLLEKNQVMNLTAITDPVKVAQLHMLDCAALLTCADFQNRALLDVGTGAGFPGLPLKILVPSLQVTLLDSLNKRVDWLRSAPSSPSPASGSSMPVRRSRLWRRASGTALSWSLPGRWPSSACCVSCACPMSR